MMNPKVNLKRRHIISALAAWANLGSSRSLSLALGSLGITAPSLSMAQNTNEEPARIALLLGNRNYPVPYDLPPIHKNVRDLSHVLSRIGFEVVDGLDMSVEAMNAKVNEFLRLAEANPNALIFFYFSGHGMQQQSENLLLSVSAQPSASDEQLLEASLRLGQEVLSRLSGRTSGVLLAAIDACRTDIRVALARGDGLNQIEAPTDSVVIFSTEAGRPAISPVAEDENTFFTGALVKMIEAAPAEINFTDLFRLVRQDVQQTMLNHPLKAIRDLTQRPFIADNTRDVPYVFPIKQRLKRIANASAQEQSDFRELQASIWPLDTLKLAENFITKYPQSTSVGAAVVAKIGAQEAMSVLRRKEVRLFKQAFFDLQNVPGYKLDLGRAARGDKDAAARIGRLINQNASRIEDTFRYEGWLQYATFLGNGIASYELALHYRKSGQLQQAGFYEAKAKELGYTPPVSLNNVRK